MHLCACWIQAVLRRAATAKTQLPVLEPGFNLCSSIYRKERLIESGRVVCILSTSVKNQALSRLKTKAPSVWLILMKGRKTHDWKTWASTTFK